MRREGIKALRRLAVRGETLQEDGKLREELGAVTGSHDRGLM